MSQGDDKMLRHAGFDRLFHWATALAMTVLLVTSFLPILGIHFAWYGIHWVTGLVLTALIVAHVVRALFWQRPGVIVPQAADLRPRGSGKYTLPQKLMHLGWTVAVLVAIVSGLLLLRKAGVPFLLRDPYARSLESWGLLTLLHDLAALLSVFLILVHVYFAILPEKRAYLRAMVKGWIRREELAPEHDLKRVENGD
jgi:cytochrome b subunit of formate dehydrogenase